MIRLNKAKDFEPEVIFWDDGSLIGVLTTAALDPVRKKMIAGGFIEGYFMVCDMNEAAFGTTSR